jgi:hypothetical protein
MPLLKWKLGGSDIVVVKMLNSTPKMLTQKASACSSAMSIFVRSAEVLQKEEDQSKLQCCRLKIPLADFNLNSLERSSARH